MVTLLREEGLDYNQRGQLLLRSLCKKDIKTRFNLLIQKTAVHFEEVLLILVNFNDFGHFRSSLCFATRSTLGDGFLLSRVVSGGFLGSLGGFCHSINRL